MAEKEVHYPCGACHTRTVYVTVARFLRCEGCGAPNLLVDGGRPSCDACHTSNFEVMVTRILACGRCGAWKKLVDGLSPWRGEEVEAAALTIWDRSTLRRLAASIRRGRSKGPAIGAAADARERRLECVDQAWPEHRPAPPVTGPAGDILPDRSDRPEPREVCIGLTVSVKPGDEARLKEYVRQVYAKRALAPRYEQELDLASFDEIAHEAILCALDESNLPGADSIDLSTGVLSVM